jgi:hypothetical protein
MYNVCERELCLMKGFFMIKDLDLTGQVIGRLLVIKKATPRNGETYWDCLCECGNKTIIYHYSLAGNKTKSCGCIQKESIRKLGLSSKINLIGRVFGRLTVINEVPNKGTYKRTHVYWICKCVCGKIKEILSNSLLQGKTKSCGCWWKDMNKQSWGRITHGGSKGGRITQEYAMWVAAKARAKKKGLPFNLKFPEDIFIPSYCPIFGIKLEKGLQGSPEDNSPSLDRIVPELGYVRGNVAVISNRANRIKMDATYNELFKIAEWLKTKIKV